MINKPLLLVLFIIFVFSCSTDKITENNINAQESTPDNTSSQQSINERLRLGNILNLETKMQWVSYMTVQVLKESTEARNEFRDALNNFGIQNVLPVRDILNHSSDYRNFLLEFKRIFELNYISPGHNCGSGRPIGGPHPNPNNGDVIGGRHSHIDDQIFENYLTSIISDDCLEYYLPNGISFSDPSTNTDTDGYLDIPIKSTAHPLNTTSSNYGFHHIGTYDCHIVHTLIKEVDESSIIVVRPFRNSLCSYDEYNFEFDEFLN